MASADRMSRWALSSFQTCLRMCVASRTVREINQRKFIGLIDLQWLTYRLPQPKRLWRLRHSSFVIRHSSFLSVPPAKTTLAAILPANRPINEPGAADDIFLGKPSPPPRVGAVDGVVAHHHVMFGSDFLFDALVGEE